jgi:CRP/FNR family transcriptional regulator, cyclic AMP receptor protein
MSAFPLAPDRIAEIERMFGQVPLLSRLSSRQRGRLARRATTRSYRPQSVIVRQGDTSMAFYVVLSGRIRIDREAEGGRPYQVWEAGPAGFFGEMGLIDDEPRAATVVAVEPTECALLARWDFQTELREDPDIALALLPVLNERIRNLNEQVAELAGRAPERPPQSSSS